MKYITCNLLFIIPFTFNLFAFIVDLLNDFDKFTYAWGISCILLAIAIVCNTIFERIKIFEQRQAKRFYEMLEIIDKKIK